MAGLGGRTAPQFPPLLSSWPPISPVPLLNSCPGPLLGHMALLPALERVHMCPVSGAWAASAPRFSAPAISPAPCLHQHPTYPLLLSLHPGLFPNQTTLTLQASSHPACLPLFHAFSGALPSQLAPWECVTHPCDEAVSGG